MIDIIKRRSILFGLAAVLAMGPGSPSLSRADAADPRLGIVQTLYDSLLAVMKEGPALGFDGRFTKLTPVIRTVFDSAGMAERAIGPHWQSLDAKQRTDAVAVFENYMIANYAARFKSFNNQVFKVDSVKETGGKPIVLTTIVRPNGESVRLSYVMQQVGTDWKIEDVYYSGAISEIARLRSDFASTLKQGGIEALDKALQQKIGDLSATK